MVAAFNRAVHPPRRILGEIIVTSMKFAAALLAAASPFALVSAALAAGTVGDVQLSSGGLAEIVRHVDLKDGESTIDLSIPVDQADDVLKSLIVRDPAGSIVSVTVDGGNAVAEAFRHLPLKREDLGSTATVVAAMVGFKATIDDGAGHKDTGIILGVAQVPRAGAGQPIEVPAVTLQHDDGSFSQVLLGPGATVSFEDAGIQKRIANAIAAVRKASDTSFRTVRITTSAQTQRTVDLSYVVAAPVWKAAYRIVPADGGKYRVQGWAVLENGTGDDWNNVKLTLSSSNPVALKQRLLDMYWRDRREVPIMLPGGSINPMVDGAPGGGADQAMNEVSDAAIGYAMPAPAMAPAMAAKTQRFEAAPSRGPEMIATEGDVGITFTLPQPVTLKAGQTLTVPIIDADLDADMVSLWHAGAGSPPQAAVFLSNTTGQSVPPGIFSVYGKDGYLGDAQVAGIPPGEKRFAAFAADPKTEVTSEQSQAETVVGLSARDGVLTVKRSQVWTTVYHITAPKDAERAVMIDHDRIGGAEVKTDGEVVSEEPAKLRVRVTVPAGGKHDLKVTETRVDDDSFQLIDSDADTLLFYASTKGIEPAVAEKLKVIAGLKQKVADAQRAIDRAADTINRQTAEQERIRANLQALPETSDSAKSYVTKLAKSEKAIEAAEAERTDAEALADKDREALSAAIAKF